MSKTPKRENTPLKENSGYSPLTLRQSPAAGSPQKNLTGPPRIARDIIVDTYNSIQHWNDGHIKGAQTVKQIACIKCENPKNYSSELEDHTNELFNIVRSLETCKNRLEQYKAQIKALVKLQKTCDPLFISLDTISLANAVVAIASAYIDEFKIKELVLENIAHCKNEHEAMFYAAAWTHQTHITSKLNVKIEALLIETGLRAVT